MDRIAKAEERLRELQKWRRLLPGDLMTREKYHAAMAEFNMHVEDDIDHLLARVKAAARLVTVAEAIVAFHPVPLWITESDKIQERQAQAFHAVQGELADALKAYKAVQDAE